MNFNSISRFSLRPRTVLLLISSVWLGWRLLTWPPMPAQQVPADATPDPLQAAARISAAHWFGQAVAPEPPALTVLGVFAPGYGAREPGFAIASHEGTNLALLPGQPLGQWQVQRIAPDGLILSQGRSQQFYPLGRVVASAGIEAGLDAPGLPGEDE